MVARVLTRVSDVDETFLWGQGYVFARRTSVGAHGVVDSLGPMSFMLTAARWARTASRSKRYLVCTNDEGPAQEHVLLMARRIASILTAWGDAGGGTGGGTGAELTFRL